MRIQLLLLLVAALPCAGCIGTLATRIMTKDAEEGAEAEDGDGSFIGAYPYASAAADIRVIQDAFDMTSHGATGEGVTERSSGVGCGVIGIIVGVGSIPLDLVIDTVLLPADLIGWSFGLEKTWWPKGKSWS
jgi:uncharacterized protein YceK